MPGVTPTDRPSPILLGDTGIDRTSAACVLRELPDRSLDASAGANSAPADYPIPDPRFIRLTDWTPTARTQPRSGGGQPVDGGTIFFETGDELGALEGPNEFMEDLQSNPQLGLHLGDAEPFTEPRVVLWMHASESVLRTVSINGAQTPSMIIEPEQIAPAKEFAFPENEVDHDIPSALLVWTLWTNPLCQ